MMRRKTFWGSFLAGILIVTSIPVFAYPKARKNRHQRSDVILIPGHPATAHGRETPTLRVVLDQAVQLYRQGLASYVLVSGGAIHNQFVEADVMAQGLIARGIPQAAIIRERQASNTAENFSFSLKLLRQFQLQRCLIVTVPWHNRKASFYANKYGIKHTLSPAPYPKEMTYQDRLRHFGQTYAKMLWQIPLA
ncbi:YdcF family protein [Loigolactobacillus backii]|uniref:DUF218 domain-containing protein n=1 Tax=Loigolactobacillus backii TaxID=375175 RepID=A0A192H0J8_9LACO|nr:YdcF family protein [Loigolactobacillus backii]ANK58852.1 hypothetical protein AYR52_00375 [Loigolactobacillus backii]ANK61486.1 hypothetical protein AYR53_01140 [Loigolactobacillus backii]ANK66290.1 hypothetical protein AYR55_00370 [Loigolactobacillus backii]ANK69315.1 hypothetical protein AYR56_03575 [Loigolactobacillus backii]MDA5388388.1 YdcF family protein [Loigolactobacillus backii]